MDARTLEALKASIAKWERNAVAETRNAYTTGSDTCALCELFQEPQQCAGCPVRERTGRPFCVKTPYQAAWRAAVMWQNDGEDARHAARAEVDFLKSLLPPEETK